MHELDSILLYKKQEDLARAHNLTLDMIGADIDVFLGDTHLTTVNTVKELASFIDGYVIGKTGRMPNQHDSI